MLFNSKIINYDELIKQLQSLKEEAFIQMRSPFHDEVFIKDFYALSIAISIINDVRNIDTNNGRSNGKAFFTTLKLLKGSEKK